MPNGEAVVAGEGIEDTMTIVCARPEWRAIAVLSVSSLAGLVLPPKVGRLIWIAQNDPPGSSAANALAEALRLHRRARRSVFVIRPPRWAKDVNELAQHLQEEEAV
jgi:Toprim domain